ncbi:MAG: LysM domain-containing protein [Ignavibacteriaceae bacterium]|nr:LysM domain-containing protein [Ignavibacteriaceae bacterium]
MRYTVQPGDSMHSIAMQYNTTVRHLMDLNPQIPNPHAIYTGETITVHSGYQWGRPWERRWVHPEARRGHEEARRGREEFRRGHAEYLRHRSW